MQTSRYALLFGDPAKAFAAGIAQLVFCSGWRAGLLVLLALALVSEWILVGAVVGGAIGTVLGRLCARGNLHAWRNGMDGFNPAILGIIGAGAFAAFSTDLGWIIAAMVFVVGIDQVIRSWAVRVGFFPLSAPSLTVAVILSLLLAPDGSWWWPAVEVSRDNARLLAAAVCIIAAMALEDRRAAGWTAVWSLVGFGLTLILTSSQVGLYVDLWGIVIPLASFSTFRLFPRGQTVGLSVLAVAVAGVLCVAWIQTPLYDSVPPLVVPVVLTLWLLILLKRLPMPVVLNGELWRCALAIVYAHIGGSPVIVALGKRSSHGHGRSDEPIEITVRDRAALRRLWQRAYERRQESEALSQQQAARLAAWLDRDVITHLWVADDNGRYDSVCQELRVDANGRADLARCIGCGDPTPWPPRSLWERMEIRCSRCGGSIVPDQAYPAARRDLVLVGELNSRSEMSGAPGVILCVGENGEDRLGLARLNGIGEATGIPVFSLPRLVDSENRTKGARVSRVFSILLAGTVAIAGMARWLRVKRAPGEVHGRRGTGILSVPDIVRGPVSGPWGMAAVLLIATLLFVHWGGLNERLREEVAWIPLQSRNLNPDALYVRDGAKGSDQQIFARLSLPEGDGTFPAVVLLHGSLGFSALQRSYADALNDHGYVVLSVDSFSARDVVDVVGRQEAVSIESMVADAFAALRLLKTHPKVDGNAVGLMGWSKGGSAALAAGQTFFREMLSGEGDQFSSIAAIYPWCGARERVMRRDDVPVLFILAGQDDWVSADACADLLAEMATLGLRARVAIYDEAEHGFDAPGTHRVFLPRGKSWRECHYASDAHGFTLVSSEERKQWSEMDGYLKDCTTRGVHVATNAVDRTKAKKRVLQFMNFTNGIDATTNAGSERRLLWPTKI